MSFNRTGNPSCALALSFEPREGVRRESKSRTRGVVSIHEGKSRPGLSAAVDQRLGERPARGQGPGRGRPQTWDRFEHAPTPDWLGRATIDGRAPGRLISVAAYSFTPRTNTWDLYAAACVSTGSGWSLQAIYGLSQGRCYCNRRAAGRFWSLSPRSQRSGCPIRGLPVEALTTIGNPHWPWVVDIRGEVRLRNSIWTWCPERTRSTGGK